MFAPLCRHLFFVARWKMSRFLPAFVRLSGLLLPLCAQQTPAPENRPKEPLNSPLWPKRVGKISYADTVKLLARSVDQFPQTTTMSRGQMTAPQLEGHQL